MAGLELLSSQRRAKVGVMFAQDGDDALGQRRLQRPVAGPVPVPGYQPDWTFSPIADCQPLDLSYAQTQPLGGASWLHLVVDNGLDSLQSFEISHVSCYPGGVHREAPKPLTRREKLDLHALKHDICI